MRKQAGFTLMEIMVAIIIVAILAGIAYPIYTHYVENSRRASAVTALQRAAAAEEKHYAAYNMYATSLTTLGYDSNSVDIPSTSEHWYTLSAMKDPNGSDYLLEATPAGPQANDVCGTFILKATGARIVSNTTGKTAEQCWGGG